MIVCICNSIRESDLKKDPTLINKVGTQCGKCIQDTNKANYINNKYNIKQGNNR